MRAVIVKQPGGPEQLELGEAPLPRPAEDELLVRVQATALNRADILQRQGKYPPPPGAARSWDWRWPEWWKKWERSVRVGRWGIGCLDSCRGAGTRNTQ